MICFGGMEKNGELTIFNDLFWFDLEKCKGKSIETTMKKRYGHSACVHQNCMYVYGGYDEVDLNLLPEDNFLCLNLETMEWKKLESNGDVPVPRNGQTLIVWNDQLIMFGGLKGIEGGYRHILCNDLLYAYSFADSLWKRVKFWGEFPIKSTLHTSEIHNNNMYVLYGEAWNGHLRNEIYCLNLETMEWKNLLGTQHTLINEWCFKHGYICIFCTNKLKVRGRYHCVKCFGPICQSCYDKGKFNGKNCNHQFVKINRFWELYEYFMSPKAPVKSGKFDGRNRSLKNRKDPERSVEKKDKKKSEDSENMSPFSPSLISSNGSELFAMKLKIIDLETYVQELEAKLLEKELIIEGFRRSNDINDMELKDFNILK
jgi:hypothetical protein